MIDLAQFTPETLLIAGTVAGLVLGATVALVIAGLFQSRRVLKARCRAFRDAENLYLKGRALDLRDQTSVRL